ncbi:hypothetical protein DFH07DRAFT_774782 [Mycena maculata]|uniref:Uncharacterized protein n=1 Tax=Mycena maculata TaxID=230809 RepID=A0AAD7IVR2_9AGAR|nr:hypothetical protein DFH07DRAFT_774782 [Mycena maculata]
MSGVIHQHGSSWKPDPLLGKRVAEEGTAGYARYVLSSLESPRIRDSIARRSTGISALLRASSQPQETCPTTIIGEVASGSGGPQNTETFANLQEWIAVVCVMPNSRVKPEMVHPSLAHILTPTVVSPIIKRVPSALDTIYCPVRSVPLSLALVGPDLIAASHIREQTPRSRWARCIAFFFCRNIVTCGYKNLNPNFGPLGLWYLSLDHYSWEFPHDWPWKPQRPLLVAILQFEFQGQTLLGNFRMIGVQGPWRSGPRPGVAA